MTKLQGNARKLAQYEIAKLYCRIAGMPQSDAWRYRHIADMRLRQLEYDVQIAEEIRAA